MSSNITPLMKTWLPSHPEEKPTSLQSRASLEAECLSLWCPSPVSPSNLTYWPPCYSWIPPRTLHLKVFLPAISSPAISPQNICRIYLLPLFGPLLNSVRASLTTPIIDTQSEGLPWTRTFLHTSVFCWNYSVVKRTLALKLLNDIINIFMRHTYLQLLKIIFLNVLGQIINLENKISDWYHSTLDESQVSLKQWTEACTVKGLHIRIRGLFKQ